MQAYLTNGTQIAEGNRSFSKTINVPSGVTSHWSFLGPVLLFCYIDDISERLGLNYNDRLYANDRLLYLDCSCHEHQMQVNYPLQLVQERPVYTPFPLRRSLLECRHFWYTVKHVFNVFRPLEGIYETRVIVTPCFASPIFSRLFQVEMFYYFSSRIPDTEIT